MSSRNESQANITHAAISPEYYSAVALSFIQTFGVFGNLLVIYSTCHPRKLFVHNYYNLVFHLALCDLLVLLFAFSSTYTGWWPNSQFVRFPLMCKLWQPMGTLFATAGGHLLVVIAIIRWRAVVYPLRCAVGRRNLRTVVIFVYPLVALYLIPFVMVLQFSESNGCVEQWPNPKLNLAYTFFLFAVQYCIPVGLLVGLYFKICWTLVRSNKSIRVASSSSLSTTTLSTFADQPHVRRMKRHRNIRTIVASVAVVVVFAVAALPLQLYWLLYVAEIIGKYNEEAVRLLFIVNLLGTSAVNPFIYGVFDKTLLAAYKRNLKKIMEKLRL